MKCLRCKADAHATCKFCGRAVCETHITTKRYATGFGRINKDAFLIGGAEAGITVEDAVWCGQCRVEYQETY